MIYFEFFVRVTVVGKVQSTRCSGQRIPLGPSESRSAPVTKGDFVKTFFVVFLVLVSSGATVAQSISIEKPVCLPNQLNQYLKASLDSDPGHSTVRLYFRRLNPVGAFYYAQMWPEGKGSYWSVFPKPEHREQEQLSDEWWVVLEQRDWMQIEGRDRQWLEDWLADQEFEVVEYYVAIYNAKGELQDRSDVYVVPVAEPEDCNTSLTPPERGWAQNLTVGETTDRQYGRAVFHWLCDGIATRVSVDGIIRGDEFCRECVIAHLGSVPHSNFSHPQSDVSWRSQCS